MQGEGDEQTAPGPLVQPDLSAGGVDEALDDRQPQTEPVVITRSPARQNRSNARSRSAAGIPGPASATDMTVWSSCGSTVSRMVFRGDDSTAAAEIMDIIGELNADGTTVMLVTHDAKVAARTDRLLHMVDGRIVGDRQQGRYPGTDLDQRQAEVTEWLISQDLAQADRVAAGWAAGRSCEHLTGCPVRRRMR